MKKLLLGRVSMVASALVILAGVAATACGDDDDDGATPDSGTTTPEGGSDASTTTGEVTGQATYNGAKKGPLIVGLFKQAPAPGVMQMPSAIGSNETPTWPGTNAFSVKNVPPGTYFVGAYIMVGPEHRMQGAQASDPITAPPVQVTVTAGASATTTVNLIDRPTGDGGTEGGTDDGGDAGDGGDSG